MIDSETAATIRLVGLFGIGLSVIGLVWAGGNARRSVFGSVCKLGTFVFVVVYFFGAMITTEPKLPRVIPRFP